LTDSIDKKWNHVMEKIESLEQTVEELKQKAQIEKDERKTSLSIPKELRVL